jgi:hypothetical protein
MMDAACRTPITLRTPFEAEIDVKFINGSARASIVCVSTPCGPIGNPPVAQATMNFEPTSQRPWHISLATGGASYTLKVQGNFDTLNTTCLVVYDGNGTAPSVQQTVSQLTITSNVQVTGTANVTCYNSVSHDAGVAEGISVGSREQKCAPGQHNNKKMNGSCPGMPC